jgi:hypothetical protein
MSFPSLPRNELPLSPKFAGYRWFWIEALPWKWGVSFGVHWAWPWRLDLHFLHWIVCIGRVPVYRFWSKQHPEGRLCSVSDSYHCAMRRPWRPAKSFDDLRIRRG